MLPRHELAIDSGGHNLLLSSNLTTAPLYQVRMPVIMTDELWYGWVDKLIVHLTCCLFQTKT